MNAVLIPVRIMEYVMTRSMGTRVHANPGILVVIVKLVCLKYLHRNRSKPNLFTYKNLFRFCRHLVYSGKMFGLDMFLDY